MRHPIKIGLYLSVGMLIACGSDQIGTPDFASDGIPAEISYNFDVKPILSDRCFNCHGPDEARREAGLRLDDPNSAYAELTDSPGKKAIVPKRVRHSEVMARIYSADPELLMPPPESKLTLNDREKAILSKWIEQGAPYEEHWAFQVPSQTEVPDGDHPVDYFIKRKIKEKNLPINPRASKESLIRRASFDLTGLPPTLEEIDAFLADDRSEAFDDLIDELLDKSSYGERMAADWMDVARYADSDGYLDDKHRDFSPWRDWVIRAFNENMPYDQFVTWQMAGDQLPKATQESILATAFNRLHRKNSEAGIVFEEYRTEYVADRVNTLGKAVLGLTLECARCHDHKYDPISQKEYYQLFAFFNSTDEMGTAIYGPDQTPGPSLLLSTKEQDEIINFLEQKIAQHESELDQAVSVPASLSSGIDLSEVEKEHDQKLVAHHAFDKVKSVGNNKALNRNELDHSQHATLHEPVFVDGVQGQALGVADYNYTLLPKQVGWYDRVDPFSVTLWLMPKKVYDEAGVFTHCEDLRLGYKGYSLHLRENRLRFIMAHSWPYNSIEIISQQALPAKEWSHIGITYDGSSRAEGVSLFIDGEKIEFDIVRDHLYKGILYEPNIHTYGFAGFRLGCRDKIKNLKGGAYDEVKIFNDRLSQLAVKFDWNAETLARQLADNKSLRDEKFDFIKLNHHLRGQQIRDSLKITRAKLNEAINKVPEIMVLGDLSEKRPTFLLERGMYNQPGGEVHAEVPENIGSSIGRENANRLDLAKWLFNEEQPLTSRVFVNRIWQQHFGRGLVRTAEDFGAQGALPSHPELLDYLATYFQESGWDIKQLHRLILTSETYQRSSRVSAEVQELDPENQWLSRGPSQRLSAEMMRDNALAISGLLVDDLGGPSVYPYQPEGLWEEVSNKVWRYPYLQEEGPGLYRRSLYTIWKRTVAPPSMLLFDAPDRSFCTVQRNQTSTPLQALALLNDPHYLESARQLAVVAMAKHVKLEKQLDYIFRSILSRKSTEEELAKLKSYFEMELEYFRQSGSRTAEYLSNGTLIYQGDDKDYLAGLAGTAHNLMNTYEAQHKM